MNYTKKKDLKKLKSILLLINEKESYAVDIRFVKQ